MKLVRFEVAPKKSGKKYYAVVEEKGKEKRIGFGARGYAQYKDQTGLGAYSKDDHLDPERRKRYQQRHRGEDKKKFSAGYFAWKYLW